MGCVSRTVSISSLFLRIDSCTHFNFRSLELKLRFPWVLFYIRGEKCGVRETEVGGRYLSK